MTRVSRVPDVTAVNVGIRCRNCGNWLHGNAYWSIRSTAHLHASGPCGTKAGFDMDDMLAECAIRESDSRSPRL